MQSFLIVSKNSNDQEEQVKKICADFVIDPLDITLAQEKKEGTLGIEDVRNFQKQMYLSPIRGTTKAMVMYHSQNLTTEAQNALLKVLEEPPNNTIIILTTTSRDALLPTVLSRCHIITIDNKETQDAENASDKLILELATAGTMKRLKIAQDLSIAKEEAVKTIEQLLLGYHKKLQEPSNQRINEIATNAKIITSLQKTHTILSTTNTNLRLAVENLLLSL